MPVFGTKFDKCRACPTIFKKKDWNGLSRVYFPIEPIQSNGASVALKSSIVNNQFHVCWYLKIREAFFS